MCLTTCFPFSLFWPVPSSDAARVLKEPATLVPPIPSIDAVRVPEQLLHVPFMKLLGRGDVKRHFRPVLEQIEKENCGSQEPGFRVRWYELDVVRKEVKQKVKYAILSHRWLDEGEPTSQDMSTWGVKDGVGYEKLREFCEKAKDYGCEFVWSDTCCIDKTSSSELDEAIRSMFKWYQNVHLYIAYLADSSTFADCEKVWFKRGWTLQEAVAPKRMKSYGRGWIPLAATATTRTSSEKGPIAVLIVISRITKIPVRDLKYFNPGKDRAAEKMSWASTRRTTRIEDVAYPLIGIFDASLMVAYGEGRKAFYRLLGEIMQESNQLDIFYWSWTGKASPYNAALPESPACYPFIESPTNGSRAESKYDFYPVGGLPLHNRQHPDAPQPR